MRQEIFQKKLSQFELAVHFTRELIKNNESDTRYTVKNAIEGAVYDMTQFPDWSRSALIKELKLMGFASVDSYNNL